MHNENKIIIKVYGLALAFQCLTLTTINNKFKNSEQSTEEGIKILTFHPNFNERITDRVLHKEN